MRIKDLLNESADGPKQGSGIIKTMDAPTFSTLVDLNKWKDELKQIRSTLNAEKRREWRERMRKSNSMIRVGSWYIDVMPLEEWLKTQDDTIPVEYARARNWGMSANKDAKTLRDRINQDPRWKDIVLDIWREAARRYSGEDISYELGIGPGSPMSPYSVVGLVRRFDLVARKHRLDLHVDPKGRRLSPHLPHPEARLPLTWGSGNEVDSTRF